MAKFTFGTMSPFGLMDMRLHIGTVWIKKKDVIQVVLILTENYINIVILLISIKFQFYEPGTYGVI